MHWLSNMVGTEPSEGITEMSKMHLMPCRSSRSGWKDKHVAGELEEADSMLQGVGVLLAGPVGGDEALPGVLRHLLWD